MSSYTYVDVPNANLVCCICRAPFIDPCTTRTCSHTFCYDCIARAIAVSRQCPIDRCPLSTNDLVPADPLIRNLVDEMVVECPQSRAGCTYTCQRLLLPAHLKDSCEFTELPCPAGICDLHVLRKDIPAHIHGHSALSPSADTEAMVSESSQETPTSYDHVQTLHSRSTAAESESDSLAIENATLRLRLSALEGVVNMMRQELQAVQRALGPWYRSEGADQALSDTQPERHSHDPGNAVPTADIQGPTMSASPSRMQTPGSLHPSSTLDSTATNEFASYFPPVEEEDVYSPNFLRTSQSPSQLRTARPAQTANPQRMHSSSSGVPPPAPYTYPPGPSFMPPPLAYASQAAAFPPVVITVAPLDPTVPLPSTLASLHASIVSLAGALGALATSRAQDALYTGEELRSLRGGMHGLRMQLHDVMTTRVAPRNSSSTSATPGSGGGSAAEGANSGIGGIGMGMGMGAPPWLPYGPSQRIFSVPPHSHMPASITKL